MRPLNQTNATDQQSFNSNKFSSNLIKHKIPSTTQSFDKSKFLEYLNRLSNDEIGHQTLIKSFENVTINNISNYTTKSVANTTNSFSTNIVNFTMNSISSKELPCKCNISYLNKKDSPPFLNKYSNNIHDDYILSSLNFNNAQNNINIWKMGFFLLAFLLSFLTIMFILTMILRIIISKISINRSKNKLIFNQKSKKLDRSSNLSSDPIFFIDSRDNLSTCSNLINHPYPVSFTRTLNNNNNNNADVTQNFDLSIDCENNRKIHKNLIITKSSSPNDKKTVTNTNLSNTSVATYSTSVDPIQDAAISIQKQISNSDFNFESTNELNKNEKLGCIYEITNMSFINDMQKINNKEIVNENNFNQFSLMNNRNADVMSNKNHTNKTQDKETYQTAWKFPDDYEALELNACSLTQLTGFNTFSDIFDETNFKIKNDLININNDQAAGKQDLSLNNNELISRSAEITQELELKLKERRKLLENLCEKTNDNESKCQTKVKIYDQIAYSSGVNSSRSSSSADIQDKSSTNNSYKNWPNEVFNVKGQENKIIISNRSCTCTCECHSSSPNHSSSISSSPNSTPEYSNKKRYNIKLDNQNPNMVIDGTDTLPKKRESIRMLIKNKTVSENKKKDALELHLNSMISTRMNTYKSNGNLNNNQ